jgi:hypothetical protein
MMMARMRVEMVVARTLILTKKIVFAVFVPLNSPIFLRNVASRSPASVIILKGYDVGFLNFIRQVR